MNAKKLVLLHVLTSIAAASAMLLALQANAEPDAFVHAQRQYDTYCVQCHGVNRDGKGLNSAYMSVQPRDHSDAKGMGDIPDKELRQAIQEGGQAVNKSILMPAWGHVLSNQEVDEMVAYLRHVCKCGGGQ